ncbi:glycosyltransferase family 39 protein [Thermoflexus sp.]|uniref:glycosyltransferase family 39 protein n=1 Tax=Thermoflexus sp. TaxID=1969742 RepID=UPI0025CCF136|nr:glycosyltransferase family 39 protein [Thermoflexus sp.]MCS7350994.1 glycosyltransferase family 39 protein [Thermoflexus sp.]MDW8180446.1 glycosyltransferase family 39 protein [Anaerolineae bacterium]
MRVESLLFPFLAGWGASFGVGRMLRALLRPSRRRPDPRLLLLLLLAFALRAGSLTAQPLWRDEVDALRFGRDLSTEIAEAFQRGGAAGWERLAALLTRPGFNGPLYFIGLFQWVRFAGDSEFALRFPSLWFGVLSVALGFALFRRYLPPAAARLTAWFFAIAPFLVWYGQEAKMYALLVFLFLAAWGAQEAARRDPLGWLEAFLWLLLGLYSHVLFALFLPAFLALALIRRGWPWKALAGMAVGGLLLLMADLPLLRWQIGQVLQWDGGVRPVCGETGFPRVAPLEGLGMLAWGAAVGVWGGFPDWGFLPLSGWMALGILAGRASRRARGALALWALSPWAFLSLLSLCRPLFVERYLIASMPAGFALAAAGWARIPGRLGRALALAPVLAPMVMGLWAQAAMPIKSDFRSAARVVAAYYQPGELILFHIGYVQHVFDYYFRQPYEGAWAPATHFRTPEGTYRLGEAEIAAQMAALTHGRRAVWLIYSEAPMWDDRDLVRRWLDAHYRLAGRWAFQLVEVRRYELPKDDLAVPSPSANFDHYFDRKNPL